jgi:hypothetical protein
MLSSPAKGGASARNTVHRERDARRPYAGSHPAWAWMQTARGAGTEERRCGAKFQGAPEADRCPNASGDPVAT